MIQRWLHLKSANWRARIMTQWLGEHTTLMEDQGSVLSTYMAATVICDPRSRVLMPSSGLFRYQAHRHNIDIQTGSTYTHKLL